MSQDCRFLFKIKKRSVYICFESKIEFTNLKICVILNEILDKHWKLFVGW